MAMNESSQPRHKPQKLLVNLPPMAGA